LNIVQHFLFSPPPGALAETPVIHQYYIIIVAIKIPGILCPAFNASRISVKIKYETRRFFPVKMKTVDADPRFYIKEIFFERDIVFELEIGFKLFWFEDEFFLQEIYKDRKQGDTANDIPDETGQ
jgi:pyoverdine/dityrosine biosynthesis protein Dit1